MKRSATRANAVAALAALVAIAGGLTALLAWARRHLVVVTIEGLSMMPTYRPGSRVLVRRRLPSSLTTGAVVVLEAPFADSAGSEPLPLDGRLDGRRWYIKRVAAVPGEPVPEAVRPAVGMVDRVPSGQLVVLGDSDRSDDSRRWGFFPASRVLGVVVATFSRGADQAGGIASGSTDSSR